MVSHRIAIALAAMLGLAPGRAHAADPKALAKCQAGIAKAGAKFVGKRLGTLAKYTGGVFQCIETVLP